MEGVFVNELSCSIASSSQMDEHAELFNRGWMNPLEVEDILHTLFTFLDAQSLVSTRRVCSKWRKVGTMRWLQRPTTSIAVPSRFFNGDEEARKEYLTAFNQLLTCIPPALSIQRLTIQSLQDIDILKSVNLINSNILRLSFNPPSSAYYEEVHSASSNLSHILQLLPNVQILQIGDLDLEIPIMSEENNETENNETDDERHMWSKIQSLQELWLTEPLFSAVLEVPQIQQKLQALKSIVVEDEEAIEFLSTYTTLNISWKIQQLTITIFPDVPIYLIRNFLTLMAESLFELKIYFIWNSHNFQYDISMETWEDNWCLPLSLKNLERLTIVERPQDITAAMIAARRINSPTWRTLASALQLPKLKKLDITSQYRGRFETIVNDWRQHEGQEKEDGSRDDLVSKSLEELYIVCGDSHFNDSSCFSTRSINLWPNLLRLNLELYLTEPSPTIIVGVFSKLKQLRSLTLSLWSGRDPMENHFGTVDWDILLSGREKTTEVYGDYDHKEPSLRSLKDLKNLKIDCRKRNAISDFLIYNELVHLKNLNSLTIMNAKFSFKALKELRKSLVGINVIIVK